MPGAAEKRKRKRESDIFTNLSSPGISKSRSWHSALAGAVMPFLSSGWHVSHSSPFLGFCWFGSQTTALCSFCLQTAKLLEVTFCGKRIASLFQCFAALVSSNKAVDDFFINSEIHFRFLLKPLSFFNFPFTFVRVCGERRREKFLTAHCRDSTALPVVCAVVRTCWKWLAFSNFLTGYLPRFLSVFRGRRRDSSVVCE